jgi:hypothetical protein
MLFVVPPKFRVLTTSDTRHPTPDTHKGCHYISSMAAKTRFRDR